MSRVREPAGFTLAELLTALVVGGLVVMLLLQLMTQHERGVRLQRGREEAQQNARSALELVASELRAVDPRAIAVAEPGTITFRTPRAWGLVCRHTPERLAALFPSASVPALRSGDEFLAVAPVGTSAGWQFLEVDDRTANAAERSQAESACAALDASVPMPGGAVGPVRMYAPRGVHPTLGIAAGAAGLHPGTPVYVFDVARYQVAQPEGVQSHWIRRNTGPAMLMHPLAGPVPEHGGLGFVYYDEAGAVLGGLGSPEARRSIQRVEVTVVALGRHRVGGQVPRDSVSTTVVLRNRF